jgi:uncharacterized protein YdeI (BOF family)
MKKKLFIAALYASLGAVSGMYAQNPGPPPEQSQPPSSQAQGNPSQAQPGEAQPATVVGCLTKGSGDHEYVITDKTGEKVNFSASEKIEAYLNQTVQLAGQQTSRGGEKAFVPQTVKQVSASCENAPKQ